MAGDALAFIPARGGSKRLPGKNIRPLAGKPLLAWTIEAAAASGAFSRLVVSSDDAEILDVARKFGAEVDRRPDELATDRARNFQVLAEYLGRTPENLPPAVALLPPTSPLRRPEDILAAFSLWEEDRGNFVISVTKYDFPPEFACDFDKSTAELRLRRPEVYAHSTQSQSVPPSVHPSGAIYLGSAARFLREQTFFSPPMRALLMPPERSLDLDYPHQFTIAASFLEAHL